MVVSPAQIATIEAAVHDVMQAGQIADLSLAVARNGEILVLRGYGRCDGDTVFPIGSLTKQFTAAIVLQQIDRGRLSPQTVYHGVTVDELLGQTSGVPNVTEITSDAIAAALQAQPLFTPGTNWAYSNTNYVLLGDLLERATNTSFPHLLESSITSPLQLAHTSAASDDAATGMTSTARDLVTWLGALHDGRAMPLHDARAMMTSGTLASGERTHYGYGFYIRNWYGWKVAEHPGYVRGASADDALVVDDGLSVAVLADATDAYLVPLTKTVVSVLLPPRDRTLVVDLDHPPENENPRVTADVREIAGELAAGSLDRTKLSPTLDHQLDAREIADLHHMLAPLRPLTLVEFIGREHTESATFERYRLSFGYKQFWMTLSYTKDGAIDTLSIDPDED